MVTPYYPPRKPAPLKRQVQCLTFAAVEHANGYWSYIARYGDITAYTMKGWPDATKWMDLPECLADAARTLAYFAEHETEIRAFLAMTPDTRAAVASHGAIVAELARELAKREAVAKAGGPKR
ncbi:hypothetical protein [Methylobacterium sp. WL6]|uniref:hypothetical protein n=1 Tax=Methylobacterium sp. WL6 TaxID=2603901 RepID=UPI0011C71C40|nr:hypothetical protein [Methylobacterium sp. WL6]TXN71634.1 hypothetical protein FV230_07750 [Methylobacterium sp. WL6]